MLSCDACACGACACGACACPDTARVVRLVRRRLMRTHVVRVHVPTRHASFNSCDVGACARIDSERQRQRQRQRRGRTTAMVSRTCGPHGDSGPRDNVDVVRQRRCRSRAAPAGTPPPDRLGTTTSVSYDGDGVAHPTPRPTPCHTPPHARRRRGHEDPGVDRAQRRQRRRRPTRGSARPPRHASGDGCGTRRRDRPGSRGARGTPGTAGCAWSRPRSWSRRPRHDDRRAATPSASP